MKICSDCKEEKAIEAFYARSSKCKQCCAIWYTDYYRNNIDKIKARSRLRYRNNRSEASNYNKNYLQKRKLEQPDWRRKYSLRAKFGISVEMYTHKLEQQNNKCAICSKTKGKRNFAVDHDHVTKRNRGLLCTDCNTNLHVLESWPYKTVADAYLAKWHSMGDSCE